LKYAFKQHDWHGISIAPSKTNGVAGPGTYNEIYKRQRESGFVTDPSWMPAKRKQALVFEDLLRDCGKVLSVGAGLGVIEKHLADAGIRVDLQECQGESLNWFRENSRHADATTFWESAELGKIPSCAYDAILSISVVYVFSDEQYLDFLNECRRILKPNGLLMIWDHDAHLPLGLVRELFRRERREKWGWVRTPGTHVALAKTAGFQPISSAFYDRELNRLAKLPWRVAGLQRFRGPSHAQLHIYRAP
jgi:SAM-dependent methyltransferase